MFILIEYLNPNNENSPILSRINVFVAFMINGGEHASFLSPLQHPWLSCVNANEFLCSLFALEFPDTQRWPDKTIPLVTLGCFFKIIIMS